MLYEIIIFLLLVFLIPADTYAFLPPEFFVQGISSLGLVLATGIAVALTPFLLFFRKISAYFKENKKFVIILITQTVVIAVLLGLFFYFKYYKPLYEDSYLFPQGEANEVLDKTEEVLLDDTDPTILNSSYIIKEGVLRDIADKSSSKEANKITKEELAERINSGEDVYCIDIREQEEYDAGHIVGAIHIRGGDILGEIRSYEEARENLMQELNLTEEEFEKAFIVLYCHDGSRSSAISLLCESENIRSLEGGAEALIGFDEIEYTGGYFSDKEIFGSDYQRKFQVLSDKAIDMIVNQEAFIVDLRNESLYTAKHVKGSLFLKYNSMSAEEYERRVNILLENKDKKIIFIANRYTELFYANLLILRLERDYGLNTDNFYILFAQFNRLEQSSLIEFELNSTLYE